MLRVGQTLPSASFETVEGATVQLGQQKGKWVHLAFHRYASCPVCNFSIKQYEARYDEISEAGLAYMPVFHSPSKKMKEYYPTLPPFPLLIDPSMKIYKQFGVTTSWWAFLHPLAIIDGIKWLHQVFFSKFKIRFASDTTMFTRPADFLISPDGKIVAAHYGKSFGDSWTMNHTLKLFEQHKAGK